MNVLGKKFLVSYFLFIYILTSLTTGCRGLVGYKNHKDKPLASRVCFLFSSPPRCCRSLCVACYFIWWWFYCVKYKGNPFRVQPEFFRLSRTWIVLYLGHLQPFSVYIWVSLTPWIVLYLGVAGNLQGGGTDYTSFLLVLW